MASKSNRTVPPRAEGAHQRAHAEADACDVHRIVVTGLAKLAKSLPELPGRLVAGQHQDGLRITAGREDPGNHAVRRHVGRAQEDAVPFGQRRIEVMGSRDARHLAHPAIEPVRRQKREEEPFDVVAPERGAVRPRQRFDLRAARHECGVRRMFPAIRGANPVSRPGRRPNSARSVIPSGARRIIADISGAWMLVASVARARSRNDGCRTASFRPSIAATKSAATRLSSNGERSTAAGSQPLARPTTPRTASSVRPRRNSLIASTPAGLVFSIRPVSRRTTMWSWPAAWNASGNRRTRAVPAMGSAKPARESLGSSGIVNSILPRGSAQLVHTSASPTIPENTAGNIAPASAFAVPRSRRRAARA